MGRIIAEAGYLPDRAIVDQNGTIRLYPMRDETHGDDLIFSRMPPGDLGYRMYMGVSQSI
jgi:hypothetical protein